MNVTIEENMLRLIRNLLDERDIGSRFIRQVYKIFDNDMGYVAHNMEEFGGSLLAIYFAGGMGFNPREDMILDVEALIMRTASGVVEEDPEDGVEDVEAMIDGLNKISEKLVNFINSLNKEPVVTEERVAKQGGDGE